MDLVLCELEVIQGRLETLHSVAQWDTNPRPLGFLSAD